MGNAGTFRIALKAVEKNSKNMSFQIQICFVLVSFQDRGLNMLPRIATKI